MDAISSIIDTSLIKSALLFGLVGFLFYYYVLQKPNEPQAIAHNSAQQRRDTPTAGGLFQNDGIQQQQQQLLKTSNGRPSSRVPPHVSSSISVLQNGTNVLSDGLVAFCHTPSSKSSNSDSSKASDTSDRAKVLTKILQRASPQLSSLPHKGSTVVFCTLASQVLECEKTRRVVYILATWYNLLVVLVPSADGTSTSVGASSNITSETDKDRQGYIEKLRSTALDTPLSESVMASHRFLWASTAMGRTAIVRQLGKVAFVVDFDPVVQESLTRFGYTVATVSYTDDESMGACLLK